MRFSGGITETGVSDRMVVIKGSVCGYRGCGDIVTTESINRETEFVSLCLIERVDKLPIHLMIDLVKGEFHSLHVMNDHTFATRLFLGFPFCYDLVTQTLIQSHKLKEMEGSQ